MADCEYRVLDTGHIKPILDATGPEWVPEDPGDFDPDQGPGDDGGASSETPVFTNEEIANYLTDGFWSSNGGPRRFDATSGDTLVVDLNDLAPDGQTMARLALDVWSEISGLSFVEFEISDITFGGREMNDAPDSNATTYTVAVGTYLEGELAVDGDRDRYALSLSAGQTVTITLEADTWSGDALDDPYLRLYAASGSLLTENDDSVGYDSRLTYTATQAETVYVQAAAFGDFYAGGYVLTVEEGGGAAAPQIVFDDDDSGAYATYSRSGSFINSAFVNVNENWVGGGDLVDSYVFQTYLHEIGHALGLGHAGDYNGSASYGVDNVYANDSWQTTVMSYFDQRENTYVGDDFAYVITPQVADIIAIRELYDGSGVRTGDTVYGKNGNTGTYLDNYSAYARPVAMTVLDDGGTDTLDFSDVAMAQRIDLRPGMHSDVGGVDGALSIAEATWIEIAMTGSGEDWLGGNGVDNRLVGNAGRDILLGRNGADTLEGGNAQDYLNGGDGADVLQGGSGGDLLIAGGLSEAEVRAQIDDSSLSGVWDSYDYDVV